MCYCEALAMTIDLSNKERNKRLAMYHHYSHSFNSKTTVTCVLIARRKIHNIVKNGCGASLLGFLAQVNVFIAKILCQLLKEIIIVVSHIC